MLVIKKRKAKKQMDKTALTKKSATKPKMTTFSTMHLTPERKSGLRSRSQGQEIPKKIAERKNELLSASDAR